LKFLLRGEREGGWEDGETRNLDVNSFVFISGKRGGRGERGGLT